MKKISSVFLSVFILTACSNDDGEELNSCESLTPKANQFVVLDSHRIGFDSYITNDTVIGLSVIKFFDLNNKAFEATNFTLKSLELKNSDDCIQFSSFEELVVPEGGGPSFKYYHAPRWADDTMTQTTIELEINGQTQFLIDSFLNK